MFQSVDVSWPQCNYHPGAECAVIVAATSGDTSSGRMFTQSTFVEDVADARAAGKEVGFYHFNGGSDPVGSARYFWSVIAPHFRPGDIVVLDVESWQGGTRAAWSPAYGAAFAAELARLRGLTTQQSRLGIYGNRSDMRAPGWGALERSGSWLYLAAPGGYPENTPVGEWSHWTILQYSSAGGIDRDESESTFAQIAGIPVAIKIEREPHMLYIYSPSRGGGIVSPTGFYPLADAEEAQVALATYGTPASLPNGTFSDRQWDVARQTAINIGDRFAAAVAGKLAPADPKAIAAAVVASLPATQQASVDTAALGQALETALAAQIAAIPAAVVAAEGKKLTA